MTGNCHVPFWSRAGVAIPRLRQQVFFEVPSGAGASLQELAEQMREAVLRQVGIPVTVGIARTKTLAKLISDTAKPLVPQPSSIPTPCGPCWISCRSQRSAASPAAALLG